MDNEDIIRKILDDLNSLHIKFSRTESGKYLMKHKLNYVIDKCKEDHPDKKIIADLTFDDDNPVFDFKITQEYTVTI